MTALHIEGMHCGSCVARVDKALRSVPGVQNAAVNLTTNMAQIEGNPDPAALLQSIEDAGYHAKILENLSAKTVKDIEQQSDHATEQAAKRLWFGVAAGIPVLALDMSMPWTMKFLSTNTLIAFAVVQLLLTTAILIYTGAPFFTGAARMLRRFSANMDLLVALGSGTAYIYSAIITILILAGKLSVHTHHLEFHAAVAIVVLVALGKYLEARAKKRAASAVANLAHQTSPTATRLRADNSTETLPAEQIQIGDRLQVLAHQQLPVDGELIEGSGTLDLSIITGESIPVELSTKDSTLSTLPGGATLADGRIIIRAISTASTSTVARILQLVNSAQSSKTQIQQLADKVAAIFVPIILALAILNFILWISTGHSWELAMLTTIATIVIACPCAMGLATPTAVTVALGRAARMGILFTNASALESGKNIGAVLFDKTGTLTTGILQVISITSYEDPPRRQLDILQLAASIEQFSDHPLAKAIVTHAKDQSLTLRTPTTFNSIPGGGVRATFDNGEQIAVGSAAFAREITAENAQNSPDTVQNETNSSAFLVHLGTKKVLAKLMLRDTLRPDAPQTLANLKAQGLKIGVISGDHETAVRTTLKGLSIDFMQSGVKPEGKAAAVLAIKTQMQNLTEQPGAYEGKIPKTKERGVAFVGDGVNDAPALAAADLGIAMATGTDLAKTAGDVLLTSTHLTTIPCTLELSRGTLRIIRQNLFWAFAYNIAAIPLAMLNILTPGMAAAAMMFSSLTVVLNALRIHRLNLQPRDLPPSA